MTDNNTTFEKKTLRYSLKTIKLFCFVFGLLIAFAVIGGAVAAEGDFSLFLETDILVRLGLMIFLPVIYALVMLHQRNNNVLYYGRFGFSVNGKTYAYSQVTHVKTVHRGRWGTYHHIYVGDEVVFKFSRFYENLNDFMDALQDNDVKVYL